MKNKILVFIYNPKTDRFLLLNTANHYDRSPIGGKFTVTGETEKEESLEKAVERELKEETGLIPQEILSLNWGSVYNWKDEEFKEMNFIVFVDSKKVILNEKHSRYKWLELSEFIKSIDWNDDKKLLKKVLENAIKKEIYFDKKERGQ